jgi:hypothetical protein
MEVPADAARGGAETTYPEYSYTRPSRAGAATPAQNQVQPSETVSGIEVLPVQGNVYMIGRCRREHRRTGGR